MLCKNCGKELQDNVNCCDVCGAYVAQPPQSEPTENIPAPICEPPVDIIAQKFSSMFGKTVFLVGAVFLSVYAALALLIGEIPVLEIIAVIAMFILYSKARQGVSSNEYHTSLRMLSGVALANYIIGWVATGLLFVMGGIFVLFAAAFESLDLDMSQIGDFEELAYLGIELDEVLSVVFVLVGIVLIVIAVIYIFVNIFCAGNMRKCAKSLVISCEAGNIFIEKLGTVRGWLIAIGVINVISALSGLVSVPSTLVTGAALSDTTGIMSGGGVSTILEEFMGALTTVSVGAAVLEVVCTACLAVAMFCLASATKDE